jgi:cytochrome c biogenesis protein CcmG/thiol:disulfide interchange protein DsbE
MSAPKRPAAQVRARSQASARARRNRRAASRHRWLGLAAGAAVVAIAIGVAVVATSGGGRGGKDAAAQTAVADRSFELLDGGDTTLGAFVGRPVVVNFLASWCVACQAELPRFQALSERLDGEVAFVGLALQDTPADAGALVARTGVRYPIGLDPDGTLFQAFGGQAMPTTVFLDAAGRVVARYSGEISAEALETKVREVLL